MADLTFDLPNSFDSGTADESPSTRTPTSYSYVILEASSTSRVRGTRRKYEYEKTVQPWEESLCPTNQTIAPVSELGAGSSLPLVLHFWPVRQPQPAAHSSRW